MASSGGSSPIAPSVVSCQEIYYQDLEDLKDLLDSEQPWYAAFGNGASRVKEISDVDVLAGAVVDAVEVNSLSCLKSVCLAFKGMYEAVQAAAGARDDLIGLLRYGVMVTAFVLSCPHDHLLPDSVILALEDLSDEMEAVAELACKVGQKKRKKAVRRVLRLLLPARDRRVIYEHEESLERILSVVAAVGSLSIRELRPLPTLLPDVADIPLGTPVLPSIHIQRVSLEGEVVATLSMAARPYVLVGMGGVGKTILASAVVRNEVIRRTFQDGIFWLRMGRSAGKQVPRRLLQSLARGVGPDATANSRGIWRQFKDMAHIIRYLSTIRAEGQLKCLVVLDDVWEAEALEPFFSTGFQLLITTRVESLVEISERIICTRVGDMTEEEAIELLRASWEAKEEGPAEEMLQVARDCGFLPLALAIVGSMMYVKSSPSSPDTWKNVHEQLKHKSHMLQGLQFKEDSKLYSVLALSFCSLTPDLMERFSYLVVLASGVSATSEMLEQLWDTPLVDVHMYAQLLVGHALLLSLENGYRIHDMVLDFLKFNIGRDSEIVATATSRQAQYLGRLEVLHKYALGGQVIGEMDSLLALWDSVESLSAVHSASHEYAESLEGVRESICWREVGDFLGLQGKHGEAESLYRWAIAIDEVSLGPCLPDLAVDLHVFAGLLEVQGKYDEAEPLYRRATAVGEKTLGSKHPHVATILVNFAGLQKAQGNLVEAENLYQRAISIDKIALGSDHPDLATHIVKYAALLKVQGRYDEAETLYRKAIAIDEIALGENHPDLATDLANFAGLLEAQGKYVEAESLYRRAVAVDKVVLGSGHPDLATHLMNFARVLNIQGKYAEAEPLYHSAIAIDEIALGSGYPDLVRDLSNFAALLEAQGKYNEAEHLYRRAIIVDERNMGSDHPEVATDLTNFAGPLEMQGKNNEAEPLYCRAVPIDGIALGSGHPDRATHFMSLAGLLIVQGKYDEAEALYCRVIDIDESTLGSSHPDLAMHLVKFAGLLITQGKFDKAEPLFRRAIAIDEVALGLHHPDLATDLIDFASLLEAQGEYDKAEPLYRRAIAVDEIALGSGHPDLAIYLVNFAGLLKAQGNYDEAERMYRRGIAICEMALGLDHPDLATSLVNFAGLLKAQGRYDEAEPLYHRAITICEVVLASDHPNLATCIANFAGLLITQGKYDEAESLYRRAVAIDEIALGKCHPVLAADLDILGGLLEAQGEYEEAEDLYRRAIDIGQKIFGPSHPDVAIYNADLAGLLKAQEKKKSFESSSGSVCRQGMK
ncbi:unnamed protein product [Choristocarpus tenellus]